MDRIQDINLRRVSDMTKLKQCIERLKCDLHVLFLSKKLNKDTAVTTINNDLADDSSTGMNATQEMSADSDKIIGE